MKHYSVLTLRDKKASISLILNKKRLQGMFNESDYWTFNDA